MAKTARRGRSEGALYRREDGMWIGAVTLPAGGDGRRRRKTVSSRDYATAARKLRDLRRDLEAAGGDLPTATMRVDRWLTHWVETIAAPNVRPKTLAAYRGDVRTHIIPAVGKHRLDRLTPEHVRAMNAAIVAKGNSSTTALRCHVTLGIALKAAEREGIVRRNVAALVKRPAKAANSRGAFTVEQAVTLIRHASQAGDPLASFYAAALLTGARRGELLGLQGERATDTLDLSWQLQRLDYTHSCGGTCGRERAGSCPTRQLEVPPGFEHRVLHGALCLTRPKSAAGWRVVPLVEPLASILGRQIPGPHGLLWTTPAGTPIDPRHATAAWRDAVAAAGLPPVPLHAARHTTATLLRAAGVPEDVILQILGHSSVLTTRGYIHADLTEARKALEGLSAALDPAQ